MEQPTYTRFRMRWGAVKDRAYIARRGGVTEAARERRDAAYSSVIDGYLAYQRGVVDRMPVGFKVKSPKLRRGKMQRKPVRSEPMQSKAA